MSLTKPMCMAANRRDTKTRPAAPPRTFTVRVKRIPRKMNSSAKPEARTITIDAGIRIEGRSTGIHAPLGVKM